MKTFLKQHLSILLLLLASTNLEASPTHKIYTYAGLGFGLGKLKTDVSTDYGKKEGPVRNASLKASYYHVNWMLSLGLGYYDLYLETEDKSSATYTKLVTETFYLDLTPQFRLTNRFSLGFSYQHLLGEEFLAGPSTALNANDEATTESLAGIVFNYDIPFNNFRIRTGLSVHRPLSVGERDITIGLFTLHFGTDVYAHKQEPKVIYKTREIIKTIPADVIELDEQVIYFELGSSTLNQKSVLFVEKLAELLLENTGDWELLKIVGHTDIIGDPTSNQRLSERRANRVKDILNKKGVAKERTFEIGLGDTQLKSKGTTAEDHKLNRRVELQFVGKLDKDFVDKILDLIKSTKIE
ncbi:MAG: OmpA family protein [Bacteriovoracaceae bacterium]